MLHLHPDVVHTMICDHMEQLRAEPERWRDVRRTSVLRRAVGHTLIRLGERVGGVRPEPVPPPTASRLANP